MIDIVIIVLLIIIFGGMLLSPLFKKHESCQPVKKKTYSKAECDQMMGGIVNMDELVERLKIEQELDR